MRASARLALCSASEKRTLDAYCRDLDDVLEQWHRSDHVRTLKDRSSADSLSCLSGNTCFATERSELSANAAPAGSVRCQCIDSGLPDFSQSSARHSDFA